MLFAICSFLFFFFLSLIFFAIIKASRIVQSKKLEIQFLLILAGTLEYKFYLLSMIEIIYNEKYENIIEKQEELKKINEKIEEKFNKLLNETILNIKSVLDYKVEYNDWKGAIKYLEKNFRVKINGHRFDN